MSVKLYSEIFQEFENAPTRKERIEVLRKHDSPRFKEFLEYAFNEKYKFDVNIPVYKVSKLPAGLNDCYLHQEVPKMYRFIENHPKRAPGLGGHKQSMLLLPILEGLHKDEAQIFVNAIKGKLEVKFLTPSILKEAYPGIDL